LSGKTGNVSEFDSCQGNIGVRDVTKSQENVQGKVA